MLSAIIKEKTNVNGLFLLKNTPKYILWPQVKQKKVMFYIKQMIAGDKVYNYEASETETCGGKLAPV